jgi:hypothetical protein
MYKYILTIAVLFITGTCHSYAQESSSVNYLASHSAYATVDEKGNMGEFSEWIENEATIKYFKTISMFIVIPENEEKGTGYFILADGVTESTNENGDDEILYKCKDAKDNLANILIAKSKTQEGQIVIYVFKENECFAYFIREVENPGAESN